MYTIRGDEYYLHLLENVIIQLQLTDPSLVDVLFKIALDENDLLTLDILMSSLLQSEDTTYYEAGG